MRSADFTSRPADPRELSGLDRAPSVEIHSADRREDRAKHAENDRPQRVDRRERRIAARSVAFANRGYRGHRHDRGEERHRENADVSIRALHEADEDRHGRENHSDDHDEHRARNARRHRSAARAPSDGDRGEARKDRREDDRGPGRSAETRGVENFTRPDRGDGGIGRSCRPPCRCGSQTDRADERRPGERRRRLLRTKSRPDGGREHERTTRAEEKERAFPFGEIATRVGEPFRPADGSHERAPSEEDEDGRDDEERPALHAISSGSARA